MTVLFLLVLDLALAQPSPGSDGRADSPGVKAIRAVADGMIDADNARDIGRVMNSYAADAWLMPPNAYLMTLRLDADGRWRISHLIWHAETK